MVSGETHKQQAQELELWDQISTTEGAERIEVLYALSHLLYKRDSFTECLQVIETLIEIYYKHGGIDCFLRELIEVYEVKAFCLSNLKRLQEAAETFEDLANLHQLSHDQEGYIRARRAAAREWYEVGEWERSLQGHIAAKLAIDINATPFSMGLDLLNIGMVHAKLGNNEDAIVSYLEARLKFKAAKNPEYVNWCDNYLASVFIDLHNGPEVKYYAKNCFTYSKVAQDLTMEGYACYKLGIGYLLCSQFEEAEIQFVSSLKILTLQTDKDWLTIVNLYKELAKVLFALGRDEEANTHLDQIKSIEEMIAA